MSNRKIDWVIDFDGQSVRTRQADMFVKFLLHEVHKASKRRKKVKKK